MSELIGTQNHSASFRRRLMATASAFALTVYVSSVGVAEAEDSDRPTVWIELGGQMEQMQGLSGTPFSAPFMFVEPEPEVFQGVSITGAQRPPRFAFGEEGKITIQPRNSDWSISAGIRYGRSQTKRHIHQQTSGPYGAYLTYYGGFDHYSHFTRTAALLDATTSTSEHHLVLDFAVGKDVGIGTLGPNGSSHLGGGVRLLDVGESMSGAVYARPSVGFVYPRPKYTIPRANFDSYTMMAAANRSFRGIGPSLSWNASAALAGEPESGEFLLDWGVNAALLFGRQKAKTDHKTYSTHFGLTASGYSVGYETAPRYLRTSHRTRSRSVTVPNIGGFAGLSLKWPNAKISFGYRADFFFNAMDTGIDARETSNLGFQGPYATISVGLGN